MSLRVWLPLNGSLIQQGISNLSAPSNNTLTLQDSGKIGKCYSGQAVYHINEEILGNVWSLCAWIKADTWYSANNIILCKNINDGSNYQFYFSIIGGTSFGIGANSSGTATVAYTFNTNTWYHVSATYDGSTYRLYVNGEEKKNGTITNTFVSGMNNIGINCRSSNTAGTSRWIGDTSVHYINDVRIYDHCLSAAEVKEIAQGLILHYKLDNNGCGGRNLMRKGTGTFHNTDKLTTITWSGWDSYNSLSLTDIDWNNHYGDYITYSCYMENVEQTAGTGSGIMLHFRYADGTYQQFGGGKNGTSGQYLAQGESGWLRLTVAIPNASTRSNPTTIARVEASVRHNSSGGASTIRYQYPQVEYGNKQTAWSWAPEDIGDDPARIEDSSGYNHNGTIVGTLQTQSNSARYDTCTFSANGANGYIQTPTLTMPTDAITMNIWFKTTSSAPTSDYHMMVDSIGNSTQRQYYEMCVYKTGYFRGGLNINGTRYADNCTSTNGCNGSWHMYTITYDGIAVKRYVDGIMEKQTAVAISTGLQPSATLRIFKDGYSSYACINASLSDFRIYCTQLLDTDIKQLYNIGMKVDKKQNIHAFEFNETAGRTQFLKTGVIKSAQVADNLLFDNKAHIGKHSYENILPNNVNIVTTKNGHITNQNTLASIPAAKIQSLAGKTLRFTYDVKADGTRSSAENNQTAWNYIRYGIHGSFQYTNASGTTGTSYPFAGDLAYSGAAKRSTQTWTVPTGYQSYGALGFSIQTFDKPASTNNETWFIQNVRLEVIDNTIDGYVTGTQIIEK